MLPFGTNTSASPQAISDGGLIVGTYEVPDPENPNAVVDHGFASLNGQFLDFVFPGAVGTTASDVNALGQIVGDFGGGTAGVGHYIYSGGKFFTVKLPGNGAGTITGINGFGTITGAIFQNAAPAARGFVGNCNYRKCRLWIPSGLLPRGSRKEHLRRKDGVPARPALYSH